ncbi:hypothetical protein DICVIV_08263 [Dictyocaulus viviparus]|uniref:Uncharacterized protein n=1 Tax=Dictyocaulus viviparus TaxID=29172 RepID=A0A0D8XMD8_DICVI|nr:hypothetical protein DICVIV_08263 [Dictyocaulus viviparus]
MWEEGEFKLGFRRKNAGPWQTRRRFDNQMIAVATQVIMNNTVPENSYLELRFDHAVLLELEETRDQVYNCIRGEKSGWNFITYLHHTPWPYFVGCRQNFRFSTTNFIQCSNRSDSHLFRRWLHHEHRRKHFRISSYK